MAVTSAGRTRTTCSGLSNESAGLLVVLLGAWGGIVPFVGPIFGFSADGSASWSWDLPHALLNLVPGAVAVAGGLLAIAVGQPVSRSRRALLAIGGLVAAVCGAWFVIGPVAWPVLAHARVFVNARPLTELAYWIGYSLGPGALLIGMGAFLFGRPRIVPTQGAEHPLDTSTSRAVA